MGWRRGGERRRVCKIEKIIIIIIGKRRKGDVYGRKEKRHPKRKFRELTECETIGVNVCEKVIKMRVKFSGRREEEVAFIGVDHVNFFFLSCIHSTRST